RLPSISPFGHPLGQVPSSGRLEAPAAAARAARLRRVGRRAPPRAAPRARGAGGAARPRASRLRGDAGAGLESAGPTGADPPRLLSQRLAARPQEPGGAALVDPLVQ